MHTRATLFAAATALLLVAGVPGWKGQGPLPVSAQATSASTTRAGDAHPGDLVLGEWWTEGREGRIRFVRHKNGSYFGITTCCAPKRVTPDEPGIDVHNPNPKLRARSTVGIVLIWDLTYADGSYEDGYVYNPRDGDTYHFEAKILDHDTLKIRGYLGIPLLGQSQVWKRYDGAAPPAPRGR